MSAHTPGPWKAVKNTRYWEIRIAHDGAFDRQLGDLCATGCEGGRDAEEEANARLCSAAPELLEIAEAVMRGWIDSDFDLQSLSRTASDAITKARGQA